MPLKQLRIRPILAILLIALAAPIVAAQEDAVDDFTAEVRQKVATEDADISARWAATYRARISYPLTVSAGVGLIRAKLPRSWECQTACPFNGWMLQLEPGLHGVQFSAGYAMLMGQQRGGGRFIDDVLVGFAAKGVLLRSWGDANLNPPDRSFAGFELSYSVVRFNFSVGALRRIDSTPGNDWITTFGFGWGF